MRGLKFLLLSALAIAMASIPAAGRMVDGRQLKSFGSANEALNKRATIVDFCRYWAHSSAIKEDKLYMSGGLATFKEDFRDNSLYFYHAVLVMDLSTGFDFPVDSNSPLMTSFPMGDSGEGTQQGAFWWDGKSYIYKYGGWFVDNYTWPTSPESQVRPSEEIWRFDTDTSVWDSIPIDPSSIHRAWGGAAATASESGFGYYLGGIVENRTETTFADAPGYLVLQDSFLNFDSGSTSFENKTATDLGHLALGNLVHIQEMGKDGILVYLGGVEGPSGWVPKGTTEGMTLRDLGTVWVYDIKNTRWYSQQTSGDTPKGRISACAVVVPSEDKTSWNIFLHGGGSIGDTGDVYGDTWVLSLPSFQWKVVDKKGDPKFEHTCHVVKGNQLLVVGGRDKLQDYTGNPALNYSVSASKWSCLKQGIFSTMNLNTFVWETDLPADDAPYQVNKVITALIGGGATGGADTLAPLSGWDDAGLGSVMFIAPPSSTDYPTKPGGPTSPTASPGGGGGGGDGEDKKLPLAPIIGGVVGGVVLISIIAIAIILLRRRNNVDQPAPISEPLPPVTATPQPPPGYVWDPQSQQYYLYVSSPPLPDHIHYPHSPPVGMPPPLPYELGDK